MKLSLNQIKKSFDTTHVIDSVSFDIAEGEFVSIIGPSGSGKSTIFNLIGGLLTPEEGEILLDGKVITSERGHMSYMPQQASLFPWRTVLENVFLGQEIQGMREEERARDMLEIAGLSHVIHQYPHSLSGGMNQRVAFIRALLSPQSLLCLDEPFSALDEFTRLDMQKWLLDIWEQHQRSVLFITHNIEEALFLSDRIIVLSDQPATVKTIIDIPFTRPRDEALLLTEEFLAWKRTVSEAMNNHVQ